MSAAATARCVIALLRRHVQLFGIVLERADVAAGRRARTAGQPGWRPAVIVWPATSFSASPDGADVYFLKSVLHNWSDKDAAAPSFGHAGAAMHERSRLLVIAELPDRRSRNAEATLFDINMLVTVGGQERTRGRV